MFAGLSVAVIDRVDTDTIIFRGADVVDGTPVLDIKPYIPYVDGGVGATAPAWVSLHCNDVMLPSDTHSTQLDEYSGNCLFIT